MHKSPQQVVASRSKPACVVSSKGLHRPATSNPGGMAARTSVVPVLLDLLWESAVGCSLGGGSQQCFPCQVDC